MSVVSGLVVRQELAVRGRAGGHVSVVAGFVVVRGRRDSGRDTVPASAPPQGAVTAGLSQRLSTNR